jgi:membrane-bound lytic murein transglycosylase MltF
MIASLGSTAAQESEDEDALLELASQAWIGDLDGIVERGFVRMATAYNPLHFSYDGVEQSGIVSEIARELEKYLKKNYAPKGKTIHVVVMPVPRDKILPYIVEGRAEIAAANLTVTPERQEIVAFADPTYPDVSELVITGPAAPDIATFDDLAESEVHVRPSSSYFEHLKAFNERRASEGNAEIPVRPADERLEDYDLLELVEAGIIPAVIVDSHKAALWAQVFEHITVHEALAVNSGGRIAWALRKDSPKLMEAVNGFVRTIRKGTLLGNILIKRYLKNPKWIENVYSAEARSRYEETVGLIKTYAGQYDFDWLMIIAQAYQESKLDQSTRSKAGAVGIMQVLPTTAADPNVAIPDIHVAENNVHAGVKYRRFLREQYFDVPEIDPVDQVLMSFAAYNAGPGNIAKARKRAVKMGFDPNVWFGHVEVAAARAISREPVIYVRNIYKYYVAYKHLQEMQAARDAAVESAQD